MRRAAGVLGLIALLTLGLSACGKYGPPVRHRSALPAAAAKPATSTPAAEPATPPAAAAEPTAAEPEEEPQEPVP